MAGRAGWVLFVATGCLVTASSVAFEDETTWGFVFSAWVAVCVGVVLIGGRRYGIDPQLRALTAIALGFFLAGELLWFALSELGEVSTPSIADLCFLLGYPFLVAAANRLVRLSGAPADRTVWLDAATLTLTVALIMWVEILDPLAEDPSVGVAQKLVTVAYLLGDLLVLALAARLVVWRSPATDTGRFFVGGMLLMFVGDVAFGVGQTAGEYVDGGPIDMVWLLAYTAIAAAFLQAWQPRSDVPIQREVSPLRRVAVLLGAIAVPQLLLLHVMVSDDSSVSNAGLIVLAGAVLFVLVAIRLVFLVDQVRTAARKRGEQRLFEVVRATTDALVLVDAAHRIVFASPAFLRMVGRTEDEVRQVDVASFLPTVDAVLFRRGELGDGPGETVTVEGAVIDATGTTRPVEVLATNLLGHADVHAVALSMRDISERKELESQLAHRAFHDPLTGLANRALFVDRVQHALDLRSRDRASATAVAFIDLDDFKLVNDEHGHAVGDRYLSLVANRLRDGLRPGDTAARLGGDEFAVLLEDLPTGRPDAQAAAERILGFLSREADLGGVELRPTASIGVAVAEPGSTTSVLLRDADLAMYAAKAAGKARVEVFEPGVLYAEPTRRRRQLAEELPDAPLRHQLDVRYTPVVRLVGRDIAAVWVELHWEHPELGGVDLDVVLPLVGPGDNAALLCWTVQAAAAEVTRWNRGLDHPLRLQVPLTRAALEGATFVDDVIMAISRTRLAPEDVLLCVPSSAWESPAALEKLCAVRSEGIHLALATESCTSWPPEWPGLPIDVVVASVAGIGRGTEQTTTAAAVVADAVARGVEVVAAQVNSPVEISAARLVGIATGRGTALGSPASGADFERLLFSASRTDR